MRTTMIATLFVCACSSGSGDGDAPLPAASSIAKAPTGAVGVDHPPPSWDPGFRAPPQPVPTVPQVPGESPFGVPPEVDGGAGGGTKL